MNAVQKYLTKRGWVLARSRKIGCVRQSFWYRPGDSESIPQHRAVSMERMAGRAKRMAAKESS